MACCLLFLAEMRRDLKVTTFSKAQFFTIKVTPSVDRSFTIFYIQSDQIECFESSLPDDSDRLTRLLLKPSVIFFSFQVKSHYFSPFFSFFIHIVCVFHFLQFTRLRHYLFLFNYLIPFGRLTGWQLVLRWPLLKSVQFLWNNHTSAVSLRSASGISLLGSWTWTITLTLTLTPTITITLTLTGTLTTFW